MGWPYHRTNVHRSKKKRRNKEKFTVVAMRMRIQRALLNAEERKVRSTFPGGGIERRLKSQGR